MQSKIPEHIEELLNTYQEENMLIALNLLIGIGNSFDDVVSVIQGLIKNITEEEMLIDVQLWELSDSTHEVKDDIIIAFYYSSLGELKIKKNELQSKTFFLMELLVKFKNQNEANPRTP